MPLFVDGLSVVYHAHNWKNESWLNQSPLSNLQAAFCWYSYGNKCSFHGKNTHNFSFLEQHVATLLSHLYKPLNGCNDSHYISVK